MPEEPVQQMLPSNGGGSPYVGPAAYIWPFATKSPDQFERVDQGWDLKNTTPGPIYHINSTGGKVEYHYDPGGFGSPYVVVILDTPDPNGGPGSTGIYYGHNLPAVANGTHVNQGDTVADGSKGPQGNATEAGWLEIGWWGSSGPMGKGGGGEGVATAAGQAMHDVLINAPISGSPSSGVAPYQPGQPSTGSTQGTGQGNDPPSQFGPPGSPAVAGNFATAELKDPKDNRPFHAFFSIVGQPKLVRGGMFELAIDSLGTYNGASESPQPRSNGQLACFFMMNPNTITVDSDFNSGVTAPMLNSPAVQAAQPYYMQAQTVSFDLVFNRQYEVWSGGIPGPSDIGVRWDIRALERLVGMYDATNDSTAYGLAASVGEGVNGPGGFAPVPIPIQVVFGGPKSFQFQGMIMSLTYTFTLFDVNMIPVEATASVSVLRQYQPSLSNADLVNNWTGASGQLSGSGGFTLGGGVKAYQPYGPKAAFNDQTQQVAQSRIYTG